MEVATRNLELTAVSQLGYWDTIAYPLFHFNLHNATYLSCLCWVT